MQSAVAAFEALLILFLIIAPGWVLRARRVVTPATMPPVTAAPIMVERAGGNAAFASQLLPASYAASAVTIPAAVWLFGR